MLRLITIGLSGAATCTHPDKAVTIIGIKTNIIFLMLRRIALSMRFVNCRVLCRIAAFPSLNELFIALFIFLFRRFLFRNRLHALLLVEQELQIALRCVFWIVNAADRTDQLPELCFHADIELDG